MDMLGGKFGLKILASKEAKQQLEDALDAEFSLPIKKGVPQIITLPIAADPGANNFSL